MTRERDIADELADKQRRISVSEFFEQNKHMLGFDSKSRSIVTATKEALDNALDVCEEIRELPDIKIDLNKTSDYIEITVEDNGPGIPEENVGKVYGSLLFGSRFGEYKQHRGQQGIGISAAVLYSQITTNEKAQITTITPNSEKAYRADVGIDTEDNEPIVENEERVEWEGKEHGTKIRLRMEGSLKSRNKLIEYLENTNTANPHAEIVYNGENEKIVYERATDNLPPEPEEIKPHPHGIQRGSLEEMLEQTSSYSLKGCLENDFSKVGSKTADNIIENLKNSYYGRELRRSTKIDLESVVEEEASSKTKEDINSIVSELEEHFEETVSHSELESIVEEVASSVENANDSRIGDTVRQNLFESLWEEIDKKENNTEYFKNLVDESTSSRKTDTAIEQVAEILSESFSGEILVKKPEVVSIVDRATSEVDTDVSFGDTAKEKISNSIWDNTVESQENVPNVDEILEDQRLMKVLHYAMKKTQVSRPSSKCLSPIGTDVLEKGLKNNYDGEFYATTKRDTGAHSGHPFLVEAGLVYGKDVYSSDSSIDLDRFANRVPLVYQKGACSITKTVKRISWRNYNPSGKGAKCFSQSGGHGIPQAPVVLTVHVASTNVPFTSESKDAIAGGEELEHEIEQAVREVARKLKSYLSERATIQQKKEKRSVVNDVVPDLVGKLANIAGVEKPDTGMTISNISKSILIQEQDNEVRVYNNTGKRRKLRIVLEGVDELSDDSDFEEENGEYVWEELVHSSNNPKLKVGGEYSGVKVENVSDKHYMINKKGDN